MRPTRNRVLVLPSAREHTGKIIIPEKYKDKSSEGKVINVGPDVTQVRVGERVIYSAFAGCDFLVSGETLRVVDETDVYAVIEPDPIGNETYPPMPGGMGA